MRATVPSGLPASLRLLIGLHATVGSWLLIFPGVLLGDLPHQRIGRGARAFARLLGARHLAEARALAKLHTADWILLSAAADATHAGTMILLAGLRPKQRKLALTNATAASMLAGLGILCARDIRGVAATRTGVEWS